MWDVRRRGKVSSFYNYQLLYEKVFWDCAEAYIITDVNTADTDRIVWTNIVQTLNPKTEQSLRSQRLKYQ